MCTIPGVRTTLRRLQRPQTLVVAAALAASCATERGGTASAKSGLDGLPPADPAAVVTRGLLDESLALGRAYLLANQLEAGNFNYQFDFVAGTLVDELQPVRQAGALWGIATIHHDAPSAETAAALEKGIDFFLRNSRLTDDGKRYPVYPGADEGSTGTLTLLTLAMTDYLRADWEVKDRARLEAELEKLVAFLLSLRTPSGRFRGRFDHETGKGRGSPSPYYDGEALLALCRYARWKSRSDLVPLILESAEEMHSAWVERALRADPDSSFTKGFYQWGSMSFFEIHDAGWDISADKDRWGKRTIALAHWMIDVHETLRRGKNTGYAYEGILCAWELSRRMGDDAARAKFGEVINRGLYKLTTWQVGISVENEFLQAHPTTDPRATGGVMNGRDDPVLRIDVTQHQMHAVILARRYVYKTP